MKSIFTYCLLVLFFGASTDSDAQELFLKNQIGDTGSAPAVEDPVQLSGSFKIKTGTQQGMLTLQADVAEHWHVYSMSQSKGGPTPSSVKVTFSEQFKVVGEFVASAKPEVKSVPGFDVKVEEHKGSISWSAPIVLAEGVDPKSLVIKLSYRGQACESKDGGTCIPFFGIKVDGKFAGFEKDLEIATAGNDSQVQAKPVKPFAPGNLHGTLTAKLIHPDGKKVQAGDTVRFELTATPESEYHIYDYQEGKADYMATRIALTQTNGWKISGPKASTKPHLDKSLGTEVHYHEGPVTWSYEIQIPDTAKDGIFQFTGLIGLQTCDSARCDPPSGAEFKFSVQVGSGAATFANFEQKTYGTAKKAQTAALAKSKDQK